MSPRFLASEVYNGARRNLSMFLSLVLVGMVSAFFVGSGLLAQRQVDQAKGDWYEKVHAFVFLCTDDDTGVAACSSGRTSGPDSAKIKTTLESLRPLVTNIDFKTSAEATKMFKEQFKNSPYASTVSPGSMPDFYEVRLSDPSKYSEIAKSINGMTGVAHVSNLHDVLQPFFSFLNMLSVGSAAIATVMVVCSVLLMVTTIRQVAFTRRRQVSIMRLVGAPNSTIYLPFIVEVVLAALIGAALACAMLWAMVNFGVSQMAGQGGGFVSLIGTDDVFAVMPWLFVGSLVLALLTSLVSLRRYLKV